MTLPYLLSAAISITGTGDQVLVAAVAAQKVSCMGLWLVSSAAANVVIKDGAGGTALTGAVPFGVNGSLLLDLGDQPWFVTTAGNALIVNLSTSITLTGIVYYAQQ